MTWWPDLGHPNEGISGDNGPGVLRGPFLLSFFTCLDFLEHLTLLPGLLQRQPCNSTHELSVPREWRWGGKEMGTVGHAVTPEH